MSTVSERREAIREHSIRLQSGDSVASAIAHLSPDDARIVGLGEATHGTRECFQQKARLIRELVTNHGYRTVAFEADTAATTALDTFVRGEGNGDPVSALAELDMWQWRTESVGELLVWLREFNSDRSGADQVHVRGVDLSTPSAPAAPLRRYFARVDPETLEREAFRTIESATVPDDPATHEDPVDSVATAAAELTDHIDTIDTEEPPSSASTSPTTARHLLRVVEQACEWARVRHEQPGPHEAGMTARDRFMAENALWALEQDRGEGVALWAHDGHIGRGTFDDGTAWADATTMGERLASGLGDAYRPIGFDFASGSFRAIRTGSGELETFSAGDPAEESATATFAAVDDAPFLLDLRAATDDDRLGPWLAEPRHKRYVGSVFDPEGGAEAADTETDLPGSFDCLLFLPVSTPTRSAGKV